MKLKKNQRKRVRKLKMLTWMKRNGMSARKDDEKKDVTKKDRMGREPEHTWKMLLKRFVF